MPVHLGSMGASVRAVLARHRDHMTAGDAWLLNSPYAGGTHLPDMTVVSPVYLDTQRGHGLPDFFIASRAHHADIGGITPGSMPAFSRSIDEEGALFEDFRLLAKGLRDTAGLTRQLTAPPYPARNLAQNLADLDAQLAANACGARELQRAARRHGGPLLAAAMRAVQDNAAECVRNAMQRLHSGAFRLPLDNGAVIEVRVDIDSVARRARVDFTGSSSQADHNFHAPRAVVVAAVLYVFRTLIDRDIPLNEGCLAPLELIIPPGSLLDPQPPAAVVAGNVETSQCIVDALYGALGSLAASQGTMNNLSFGDAKLQYYETIAGGAGASPDADGCSAVQTHMTNSRLTDPEILEARFPVRVLEFSIRRGSGGAGAHRGGDGACRRLQFLAPLSGAMLANRRTTRPFGLAGGGAGASGITRLHRRDGRIETLPACASFELHVDDVLEVLTPGGGGFGAK
jgi:5-oxoprolinase (ATP-hydrolysing)